ncbi:endopeptidase La [Candidatus Daviesbacteria bacterium RIFCSPHIGHO2_01_FULL_40_24]|uniref:Lon protease n=1 Tax=Candidatus Daviesbacteria bacterium GW2011_GWC2_40_12 TaxID=1618431 RepID=A0A0G0QQY8_9BACT|nr:MAG: Lon protease [Candidatus Daviesbacteria bacterium GW2011_GWA2_39_33]KKR42558.1 MAG: Lon protease [Candidatus Daviesbacteria bacterium GW2011_GWC2_40_12]OGE21838.1 MAG: endopeptidase La [Candidatus Daviesbacteria bacterium RIFCSPHIGHO2_01_FULL_40_24]OGE29893.1 MAG: endopeptidase La [Candidatus Daviesbacteria bacterium RIFCSPHIGHO2_02_FULL_40_16]OGE43319.1 MAG: endopeptidase La [Candidatus Daviesbacteria bacterium RIFCSPLOWO2_01_FULL_39_23]OGE67994.1 MAG: endopeptidase La [Candidatus Dav
MGDFIKPTVNEPVKLKPTMPVGPLRDTVIFPGNSVPIISGRSKSKTALDISWNSDKLIVFVTQKNAKVEDPKDTDLYKVGTVCLIRRVVKNPEGEYTLQAEGLSRVYLKSFTKVDPYLEAEIEEIPELYEKTEQTEALVRSVREQVKRFLELGGNPFFDQSNFANWSLFTYSDDPNQLVNSVTQAIDFKTIDKQQILEMVSTAERLQRLSELLAKEIRILEISQKISSQTQERVSRMTKEAILREQMKSIEEELGGADTEHQEIREFELKIKKAGMPKEVLERAKKELMRLSKMSSFNPEAGYIRNYLEWLTDLPWKLGKKVKVDLKKAESILEEDHYGLKKVKERIIEYLAVYKLAGKMRGSIICFVGPPGTGKTSIGKSIARALGRKFVKVSLGGIRDEAEIRGHRRTYVGSMPGRIVQGIKQAGATNPVFMLDEIDKIGADYRGDPSAALLEALDPEQNEGFSDHYLEVPYDLSNVMFITTANIMDTIPPALRDRLEVIRYPGYTEDEKFQIAKKFLIPKQVQTHGLNSAQIEFKDEAVNTIIREYTREAGVRGLERELSAVIRKVARKIAEGNGQVKKFDITSEDVHKFLGPIRFLPILAEKEDEIGMVTGLSVTEAGGEVLFIEVTLMPGKGNLILTGQLGDVMKESGQAAMSYVRSNYANLGLPEKFFHKVDVHVHVPEGAIPKDGPSAGISLTTAIVSAFTKIPVHKEVAMTGEVTLRGRVLEIGGFKEKILAAHRAGVKTIIAPQDNEKDLEDIPDFVQKDLKFVFAKHMDQVLKEALVRPPQPSQRKRAPVPRPAYIA